MLKATYMSNLTLTFFILCNNFYFLVVHSSICRHNIVHECLKKSSFIKCTYVSKVVRHKESYSKVAIIVKF